ncbi:site-specific integrase [Pseudodesulfovibrio sediminis]|nr:site-specific integrase [Pseudodesulfovibrio sediminis]
MKQEEIQAIADNHIRTLLNDLEEEWATSSPSSEASMEHDFVGLDEDWEAYWEDLQKRDYRHVRETVDQLIQNHGLDLDQNNDAYKRLCRAITQSSLEFCEIAKKRLQGIYRDRFAQTPQIVGISHTTQEESQGEGVPLTQVIDAYTQEQTHAGRWEEKSKKENHACYQLFLEYAGEEITTGQITYPLMRDYKTALMGLPPNMKKAKAYRDMTIHELLTMDIEKTMSTTTVNKYLNRIATLFKYALKNGWMQINPAEGMQLPEKRRDDELRATFTDDDLKKLFHSEQYTQDTHKHPYQFWVLPIALFTGMRQNEIAQLHLDDIRQDHDLWVFDINANAPDKHIKTKNSKRLVPMHPFLAEALNLPGYAQVLRDQGQTRLFPEIKCGRDRYGQTVSRWFNGNASTTFGYKGKCGIEKAKEGEPKKDFHSFRHTLINHLKQKLVDPLLLHELDGHAHNSMTMGRYGKQYRSHLINEHVVMHIDFHRTLDLDHLLHSHYAIKKH